MPALRFVFALVIVLLVPPAAWSAPEGTATWASHVSLVPTWLDPGETTTGTQFMVTKALHDAMLKPMPGNPMAPSLAESWTASPDGLTYEFRMRKTELDRKKREATLHKIQQLVHEKAMFAPIWELAFMNGHGPRMAESGLGLITDYFYSAPYEDVRLKGK